MIVSIIFDNHRYVRAVCASREIAIGTLRETYSTSGGITVVGDNRLYVAVNGDLYSIEEHRVEEFVDHL